MPKRHDLKLDNISKFRYREMFNWCLQYKEWKNAVESYPSGQRSKWCSENIELLESTLRQAIQDTYKGDIDIYPHMLEAITQGTTYVYLDMQKNIPAGKYTFNKIRQSFFSLLNKRQISAK